jgi:hypothetical protein
MTKSSSKNTLGFKLTNRQLTEIRKYLPYGFFTALAEKHDTISLRQMKEVMAQRSANAEHNEIVWKAVKKKLTLANRQDLITLVDQRLFFCKNLLVV